MNKEQDSIEPDAEKEDPDIITDYCYSFHIDFLKVLCISKFKNKKNAKILDWQPSFATIKSSLRYKVIKEKIASNILQIFFTLCCKFPNRGYPSGIHLISWPFCLPSGAFQRQYAHRNK